MLLGHFERSIRKHTYGFPPGIPVRLGGIPGTRIWGCGSKPTLKRKHRHFMNTKQTHTHPWALAKWAQVNTNLWNRTQTLKSTKQTDTLEQTHPLNLNDKCKGQQTHRSRVVSTCASPVQHTLAADKYKTWVSIKCCPDTDTAARQLNLFKQCNEHYANTVKSAEMTVGILHTSIPTV